VTDCDGYNHETHDQDKPQPIQRYAGDQDTDNGRNHGGDDNGNEPAAGPQE
jgi:hypothetical protein